VAIVEKIAIGESFWVNMCSRNDQERQLVTANISKLGVNGLRKVIAFNQNFNGLTSKWLQNSSLLILANR